MHDAVRNYILTKLRNSEERGIKMKNWKMDGYAVISKFSFESDAQEVCPPPTKALDRTDS
jgi:hypothetical protein